MEGEYDNTIRFDDAPGDMEYEPVFEKELTNITGMLFLLFSF